MTAWGSVAELLGEDLEDVEYLGRGSSGAVYRAFQRSLGRAVAVKVFSQFAGDADRVVSEARAQARLSWHGNVVSLYDQGVTPDGFPYLVMEYASGGSLKDRVDAEGPLDDADWLSTGLQLASALAAAHEAGVVHCDVKPSNVLFAADGTVRLADFGIAKATGMATGTIDSIQGSLGFVAPELLDGEKPKPANDVYSLALTLAYAHTGRAPLEEGLTLAQAVAAVNARVPAAEARWPDVSEEVSAALRDACAAQPTTRPGADALAEVLREAGSGAGQRSAATARRPGRWAKVAAAAGVVGVVAVVGALLARSPEPAPAAADSQEPAFDLCAEYETFVRGREDLITEVSADLEQSSSPAQVADKLFNTYPRQFADVSSPFLDEVLEREFVSGQVTRDQLASMVTAENLRVLDGGKSFLFDGETGGFDPVGLPIFLVEPARVFSEVNEYATEECPAVEADFSARKARLSSAIFSNLSNPGFMEGFYSDPTSHDVLGAGTVLLVATYAWDFFHGLLIGHADWLFETMERHDDVRRVLSVERPEALLAAVDDDPSLIERLRNPEWLRALQAGLDQSSPAARLGMLEAYGPEIESLGLVVR